MSYTVQKQSGLSYISLGRIKIQAGSLVLEAPLPCLHTHCRHAAIAPRRTGTSRAPPGAAAALRRIHPLRTTAPPRGRSARCSSRRPTLHGAQSSERHAAAAGPGERRATEGGRERREPQRRGGRELGRRRRALRAASERRLEPNGRPAEAAACGSRSVWLRGI